VCYFSSCKKDAVTAVDFSKYTATDSNCLFTGTIDNTDWTNDAEWSATENALMNFSTSIATLDSITGYVVVSALCPNPGNGVFTLRVNTERECKMKIACVNTEMETLFFTTNKMAPGPNINSFDFTAITAFHKNTDYRMYYAFYTSKDSVYYKGHGDFRIE
jgi:hypothetical protein